MKKYLISLLLTPLGLFLAKPVFAHCPLCVAGAGAGLSLSRVIGIDDTITGVWLAAFLGATSLWLANSINKKYVPLQDTLIYVAIYILTIISFYRFGLINEHNGLILSLPKLTLGMIVGGASFYLIDRINHFIRMKNGKVLFPYQPIAFSLGAMLVLSIGFYVLLNYII